MNPFYAFFLLSCLLPVAALRAQGRPQPRPAFEAIDTDHDGALSADELRAAPTTLLRLDLNHDGQLTPDEILPRLDDAGSKPDELVKQLMLFDRNGDGVLTLDELPTRMTGIFTRGDTDRDGKLTAAEIRAMALTQSAPNGIPLKPGEASYDMRLDPILYAMDSNHDGMLSAAEITAAGISLLTLDTNQDGILSADEIKVRRMSAQERSDHLLEEWDTDKDGKLSRDEAPERMLPDFEKIDTDRDGYLQPAELTAFYAKQATPARNSGTEAKPAQPAQPVKPVQPVPKEKQ